MALSTVAYILLLSVLALFTVGTCIAEETTKRVKEKEEPPIEEEMSAHEWMETALQQNSIVFV